MHTHEAVIAKRTKQQFGSTPTLYDRMISYKHDALRERMIVKYGWSEQKADNLFFEMKRFLYLCATNESAMAPPEEIDEIWHNFILFTKDYADFCFTNVGAFLHHQPLTIAERERSDGSMITSTLDAARAAFGDLNDHWAFTKIPGSCGPGTCGASTNCQGS